MKNITVNKADKIVSMLSTENYIHKFIIDGEEIEVEFKRFLTLPDYSQVIDNTVNGCFSDGFAPEYKEVLFFKNFIEVATNLPLPMMNSGKTDEHNKPIKIVDLEKLHEWSVGFNSNRIFDADMMVCDLVSNLRKLIEEKLEFQKSLICHPDRDGEITDAIMGFISNLNSIVSKYADNLDNIDLQKLAPAIMELSKNKLDKDVIKTILEVGSAGKVAE